MLDLLQRLSLSEGCPKRSGFGHAPLRVYESKLNRFRTLAIFRTLLSDKMSYTSISANFTFWPIGSEAAI